MEKKYCPFSDLSSDYCCNIALDEKESYENCHECAIEMYIQLAEFIEHLIKSRKIGIKND